MEGGGESVLCTVSVEPNTMKWRTQNLGL